MLQNIALSTFCAQDCQRKCYQAQESTGGESLSFMGGPESPVALMIYV